MLVLCCLLPEKAYCQSSTSNQFWTKYRFSHSFGKKWASEIEFTGRFSDAPDKSSIFSTRSQFSAQGWAHYHLNSRWRLSGQVAYFDNPYLPDIDQKNSEELRFSLQGLYFIHKIGYTLSTRGRAEFRFIKAEGTSDYMPTFRYRQQIKYQKPLNSKSFRKGVFYIVGSDELYFRINSSQNYSSFLDRNQLTLGGGYVVTDNLQVELAYVNVYVLKTDENQVINALSFTLTYNNLLGKIRETIKKSKKKE